MNVLYLVLPLALLFAFAAVVVFVWAVRSGQFDDLETPAVRVLHDDETEVGAHGGSAESEEESADSEEEAPPSEDAHDARSEPA